MYLSWCLLSYCFLMLNYFLQTRNVKPALLNDENKLATSVEIFNTLSLNIYVMSHKFDSWSKITLLHDTIYIYIHIVYFIKMNRHMCDLQYEYKFQMWLVGWKRLGSPVLNELPPITWNTPAWRWRYRTEVRRAYGSQFPHVQGDGIKNRWSNIPASRDRGGV